MQIAHSVSESMSNTQSVTFDQFEKWYSLEGGHSMLPWLELLGWPDGNVQRTRFGLGTIESNSSSDEEDSS